MFMVIIHDQSPYVHTRGAAVSIAAAMRPIADTFMVDDVCSGGGGGHD